MFAGRRNLLPRHSLYIRSGTDTLRQQRPPLTTTKGSFAMATRADITPELIRQLLRYEPETGKLFWLERCSAHFMPTRRCGSKKTKSWNTRFAGKEAMTANNGNGYLIGEIFNIKLYTHRVIWALVTGEWPVDDIDHIDGVRWNNIWTNLRAVSRSSNMKNCRLRSDNSSGQTGVHWIKADSIWVASITSNGTTMHLGRFTSKEAAIGARKNAEGKFNFTPRHGTKGVAQ